MVEVHKGRYAAEIDGDFVVFLIGARPNWRNPLRSVGDLGGRRGMRHMLDYLIKHPERGLLGYEMGFPTLSLALGPLEGPRRRSSVRAIT